MDVKKEMLWRVYLVYFGVLLFALAIIGRVVHIQFVEGDALRKKAEENSLRYFSIDEMRGSILASDGSILATSIPIFDVRIDASTGSYDEDYFRENVDSLAICLTKLFNDKSRLEYKNLIKQAWDEQDRFCLLHRNVTYAQLKKIRTFPIFRLGKYKGGLVAVEKSHRELPFKMLASRTIGFLREDYGVGLEKGYTKYLEGESGKRLMRKLSNGAWMPVNSKNEVEPRDGNDIVTSIDINVQDVAEDALMRCLIANEADHGCAILMEVSTGQIKAIANLTRDGDGSYTEKMNYAIQESTEPGSTFKLASLMVALEDGRASLDDTVDLEGGQHWYCNQLMKDSHHGGGRISVRKAFEISSNVGISKVLHRAYKNDPEKFIDGLYRMGINKPLNLDIPGEGKPRIKNDQSPIWTDCYSLPWMAVGYELTITPLQLLTFYNAVANNGVMVKPMFVKEIRQNGKVVQTFEPQVINKSICSKSTLAKARSLLEGVVKEGTAKNLFTTVYSIAGKTGTAQIYDPNGGFDHLNYKASFCGYFPAENPKYSCIVVVNNPSLGTYYGGAVSAPVFKEIADKVYATQVDIQANKDNLASFNDFPGTIKGFCKDVETIHQTLGYNFRVNDPSALWVEQKKDTTGIVYSARQYAADIVPDVKGMGVKDAIYLLETRGLKVKLNGRGIIRKQSIEPGTKLQRNSLIILETNS